MVRPANFGFNEETADNNSFQSNDQSLTASQISKLAISEFDEMVMKLKRAGVNVIVVDDTVSPIKPDAVFPNNWFSTHHTGVFVSYPMYAASRRTERREDIYELLNEKTPFRKKYTFDFYEEEGMFLEGTGSMILDRVNRICYACISPRTDIRILDKFCVLMNYKKIVFHAVDKDGEAIYHTNVMMALAEDFVIICMETISDDDDKKAILKSFKQTNKELIEISLVQMEQFAGNMLQVFSSFGTHMVMSRSAYNSLNEEQILKINQFTNIEVIDIPTIEKYGGGSVRCMMAEVFSPQ